MLGQTTESTHYWNGVNGEGLFVQLDLGWGPGRGSYEV